jgi:GAF domain-containing protein
MGGVVYRDSVSATAFLNLHSRFGRFVSALKIPFPGNGDFGSKRRGSNARSSPGTYCEVSAADITFCAHVIYNREPMIVPDTFQDSRFADNPFVINEPRIRFYAGYPLILDNGSCIGTLRLLDTRPRTIDDLELERLRDLADIALREICASSK